MHKNTPEILSIENRPKVTKKNHSEYKTTIKTDNTVIRGEVKRNDRKYYEKGESGSEC